MSQTVLIIDDDPRLTDVLKRRFDATGEFSVTVYQSASEALKATQSVCFAIVLDMMMKDELGLDFIEALREHFTPRHLIILTGYASIATTVTAMKRGATDYLAKPISFAELRSKLTSDNTSSSLPSNLQRLTAAQVEWEHIQRVLSEHNGNISRTADALGMHRRSLQRKLQKYSPTKK